jgi:acyl-CoA synthetase (AMP-forming)/AMP-acid ligase II
MSAWKLADVWETIAARQPDRPAIIQGDRVVTWGQFDARADALAAGLVAAGVSHDAKVAAYLFNGPEYLETYFAAFKAGLDPINTNYRYGGEELTYLFDNADAQAVVFHAGFTATLEAIRPRLPKVKLWIAVAEPGHPVPAWAQDYETLIAKGGATRPFTAPWGRSPDDLLLLYTGGTTGMPKGVMWRQDDLFNVLGAGGQAAQGVPPIETLEEAASRLTDTWPRRTSLVACPLMHGTGQFSAFITLNLGGAVALLPSRGFSAIELWNEVVRLKAEAIVLVGLAFSTPMLEALEADPGRWDLAHVQSMSSSGSMWSQENKRGLLAFCPNAMIFDSFGSSEAVGLGASASAPGQEAETAAFMLGPNCAVFVEDGSRRVEAGSGERGLVAVTGFLPIGYYKDPEKTAKTFKTMEGLRWSIPGDWAEVNLDGTLKLLGRGSQCINTGGEKVFPEEVEEALKTHVHVRDAVVVGVPDPRFGERICAVVEADGDHSLTLPDLAEHVRLHLAPYKAPRELVIVQSIGRAPNGKVDYKAAKETALRALGVGA